MMDYEYSEFDDAPYDPVAIEREARHQADKAKYLAELWAHYRDLLAADPSSIESIKAELIEIRGVNNDVDEGRAPYVDANFELESALSQVIEEFERQTGIDSSHR